MTYQRVNSWPEAKIEMLRRLWAEGKSAAHIAALLGRGTTRNAVIGKIHRLGLASRGAKTESARLASKLYGKRFSRAKKLTSIVGHGLAGHIAPPVAKQPWVPAQVPPDPDPAVLVPFTALEEHSCRWRHDLPGGVSGFCPHHAVPGKPWCEAHLRVVYVDIPVKIRRSPQRQPTFYEMEKENA